VPIKQQSGAPIYKETSNLPVPRLDRERFSARNTAGASLARLLKVGGNVASSKFKENKAQIEAQDDVINVAQAQLGLEEFNRGQASNGIDLITGDYNPDVFKSKKGQLAGTDLITQLRDRYTSDRVYDNTDPEAFNTWVKSNITEDVARARTLGPSYYAGFIKELGSGVALMGKEYTGQAQKLLANQSRRALTERMKATRAAEAFDTKSGVMRNWLKGFLASESNGNWNAWFGNSGNTEDLSRLSLGDILKRQARPGDDAAGLIQIVPGTLKGMISKYGYSRNTKFTPQVQTEMALLLMKEKGLDKWLKGDMPDGAFADRLAQVWAGFKTSKGVGVYDGVGPNRGTQDQSVTVRKLSELRTLMDQNPQLKKMVLSKNGIKAGSLSGVIDTGAPSRVETSKLLKDEANTGVNNKDSRDDYTNNILVQGLDGGTISPDEIEDEITAVNLNKEQAQKVRDAAEVSRVSSEAEGVREDNKNIEMLGKAIISGDQDALASIKATSPSTYATIMRLQSNSLGINAEAQVSSTKDFLASANYGSSEFAQLAAGAVLKGNISVDTYKSVSEQNEAHLVANDILRLPAVSEGVTAITNQVPVSGRRMFKGQLSIALADLSKQHEGQRPPINEIMEVVQAVAQQVSLLSTQDAQARLSRPEYNQPKG